jgi:putative ABC transport system permease protein
VIPDRLPLAKRLRRVFWPVSIESEIADELRAHIELQTRRYMEAGLSEEDARAAARQRFGDIDRVRHECRDIRDDMETQMQRAELREELRADVAFAFRTLRRSPLFATIAVLTIAVAIGANTAIFSVVNTVLLQSLPYRHADRAALIWNSNSRSSVNHTAVAIPEYFDLKEQLRAHDAVGAIRPQPSAIIGDGSDPERLNAYVVTPNMFELLGVTPMIGRSFGGDDGTPGATRVIILSHALWMRRFGGDPSVVGHTVNIAGFVRTIVGVMAPETRFPDAPLGFLREHADLWIPSTYEASRNDERGNQIIAVVARRAPGVTGAQAQADLDAVTARWRVAYPERYATEWAKDWSLATVPLRDQMVGSVRTGLFVIAACVGLVLLIACVNVANLMLARGAARQKELAIRLALGAGRARLVRQLLTESVVLAAAGGAFGLLLAWAGVRALVRLDAGNLPRLADTQIDAFVLFFSLAISIATGLVVGLIPAFQQSADGAHAGLNVKTSGNGDAASRGRHRLRVSLVVAQVAMALVVLVAAGLLGRSFLALAQVKPGFSSANVMSFQLTLTRPKYDSTYKVIAFYQQAIAAVSASPSVISASGGYPLPMSGDGWSGSYYVQGEPDGPNDPVPHGEYAVAMPGFFQTLSIPLIAGRDFAATDVRGGPSVVIVDVALAQRHWGSAQNAIGKGLNPNRPPRQYATVIGVVGHVHRAGPHNEGEPQIYVPHAQSPQTTVSIVARGTGAPTTLAEPLRAAVRGLDRDLPVSKLRPMDEYVSAALAKQRFNTTLVAIFGCTALLLATVGLYGVMAYLVSQRTREIGIRIALGGQPGAIRAMVLREGILISVGGLVVGAAISLAASRAVSGLLFGVRATDAVTYGGIAALLLVVGAVASYGPARRATRIDPLVALRE